MVRFSYRPAVMTLSEYSAATTAAAAAKASATRHPAVHPPYHPIQLGSIPRRPAACQATVLTSTDAATAVNWTVDASASNLSSTPAARRRLSRDGCGSGPPATAGPPVAAAGGNMK